MRDLELWVVLISNCRTRLPLPLLSLLLYSLSSTLRSLPTHLSLVLLPPSVMDSSDFTDTSDSSSTVKEATRPTAQARKSNTNLTAPSPPESTFAPLAPCVSQSSAKSKSKKSASSKDSSKLPTSVYVDGGGVEGSSQPSSDGAQAQERIDFRREISAVQCVYFPTFSSVRVLS